MTRDTNSPRRPVRLPFFRRDDLLAAASREAITQPLPDIKRVLPADPTTHLRRRTTMPNAVVEALADRPGLRREPSTIPDLERRDSSSFPDLALPASPTRFGVPLSSGEWPRVRATGAPARLVLPQLPPQPPKRRRMVIAGEMQRTDGERASRPALPVLPAEGIASRPALPVLPAEGMLELNLPPISKNEDLKLLRRFTRLQALDLSGSAVSDVAELACLRRLRRLSLARTPIVDLRDVSELVALRVLDLSYTGVSDLRPLRSLAVLEELDLSFSTVLDLRPLAQCHRLKRLVLRGTPVEDVAPLAELRHLELLDLKGCPVRTLRPLRPLVASCRIIVDAEMAERLRRSKTRSA